MFENETPQGTRIIIFIIVYINIIYSTSNTQHVLVTGKPDGIMMNYYLESKYYFRSFVWGWGCKAAIAV